LSVKDRQYIETLTAQSTPKPPDVPPSSDGALLQDYDPSNLPKTPSTVTTKDGKKGRVEDHFFHFFDCIHPAGVSVTGTVTLDVDFAFPTRHGEFYRRIDHLFVREIRSTPDGVVAVLNDGKRLPYDAGAVGNPMPLFTLKIDADKATFGKDSLSIQDVSSAVAHHETAFMGHAGKDIWSVEDETGKKLDARRLRFRTLGSFPGGWRYEHDNRLPQQEDELTLKTVQSISVKPTDSSAETLSLEVVMTDGKKRSINVDSSLGKARQVDLAGDDRYGHFAIPLARVKRIQRTE
jgi:hypothetical protein